MVRKFWQVNIMKVRVRVNSWTGNNFQPLVVFIERLSCEANFFHWYRSKNITQKFLSVSCESFEFCFFHQCWDLNSKHIVTWFSSSPLCHTIYANWTHCSTEIHGMVYLQLCLKTIGFYGSLPIITTNLCCRFGIVDSRPFPLLICFYLLCWTMLVDKHCVASFSGKMYCRQCWASQSRIFDFSTWKS